MTQKLSEEIKAEIKAAFLAGELQVRAADPRTGEVALHAVKAVLRHHTPHKHMVKVTTVTGLTVRCTQDHSLFKYDEDTGGFAPVDAQGLHKGDLLVVVRDGGQVFGEEVTSMIFLPPEEFTYDLSVPGPENFALTNGILAHNSYSIGGISLDLDRSSKYEGLKNNAEGQFDKMLESKVRTVKIIRGLQQSRLGAGIRSSFGPATSSGVLTPQKYMGF